MGALLATGGGGESSETKKSKTLDTKLDLVAEDEGRRIRCLVLGLPRSGKSTFIKMFKQVELKQPCSAAERKQAVADIHAMVIASMQTLVTQARERGLDPLPTHAQTVLAADPAKPLTEFVAQAISTLWLTDEAVKAVYAMRNKFVWYDGAAHFFGKVVSISTPGWVPDNGDVLKARTRQDAAGVREEPFFTDLGEFSFIDTGGQSGDPKKWLSSFAGVAAVIFVAALSDYDCVCDTEPSGCRLQEAIVAFAEAANSPYFDNAAFFLLLNKADLFQEKIARVDLRYQGKEVDLAAAAATAAAASAVSSKSALALGMSGLATTKSAASFLSASTGSAPAVVDTLPSRFLDYQGGTSYFQALAYLQERFLELSRRPGNYAVVPFVINCTDEPAAKPVVQAMKVAIAKHALETGADLRD